MDRRHFLLSAGTAPFALSSGVRAGDEPDSGRLLVVIDLVGGNDALNTVVPFSDPLYSRLRPTIGLDPRSVLPISRSTALHPAMRTLMPLWDAGELAILQGVGCAAASLSHHRAIEIMDSASDDDRPLLTGWLGRSLSLSAAGRRCDAQALSARIDDCGLLEGVRRYGWLDPEGARAEACGRFGFPDGELGAALASACALLASGVQAPVVHVALHGFDTHESQPDGHAGLLGELAASLAALRDVLRTLGRWDDTLVMTRSEFGRRAHENLMAGTDHGGAGVQFLAGGRVTGGLHGAAPNLALLDERGNLPYSVDFRAVCAAVVYDWFEVGSGLVIPAVAPMPGLLA